MQKNNSIALCLLLVLMALPFWSSAQILDDSTKLVYGPKTTQFVKESDVLFNTGSLYYPDTTLRNFHRFTELEARGYRYQNLGNLGTAMGPIFYEAPEIIGERTGYYVYDHWFLAPEDIRYFNTKSPYSRLKYFLAGNGRSWLDVTHARNINPRWNVGFDFRRLSADKQIGPSQRRDDKQMVSTGYDLFSSYTTKNGRYQVMGNISRIRHYVKESGGIRVEPGDLGENISEIIEYDNSEIRLQEAQSELLRFNYHLFHQYKVNELADVYHRFDRLSEDNEYLHTSLKDNLGYYRKVLISPDSTVDRLSMKYMQNELGVKGDVGNLYYRLYYKRRDIEFNPKYLLSREENEDYAGFNIRLAADSTLMISAEAEYLTDGFYRAGAFVRLKWLQAGIRRQTYKPAFITETYFGNHGEWYNDFTAPVSTELTGSVTVPFERIQLKAGLRAQVVENHIYFTADSLSERLRPVNVRPEQAGAAAQILSPYAFVRWEFALHFFWENEVTYTMVSGKSAHVFQIPDILLNSGVYFEGDMFEGNLYGQIGLDVHWKSAYYANAYDPVTQQFLVQNEFEVPAYPIVDLFFGFRIARTRVFLRMSHINQGIPEDGYFLAPYYSGTERTFDLGIDWLFFD